MKQLGELKVSDYMSIQATAINDTARLTDAIRIMDAERFSLLPVVDAQEKLIGVLSVSDLIETVREVQADLAALPHVNEQTQNFLIRLLIDQGDNTRVKDVMTSPAKVVFESMNMVVAAKKLKNENLHHLPVVNEAGKPIGVISSTDFVRAFADYGAILAG